MFIAKNSVRMHDTDMAGILFFANQFRFVHDALEDFSESEGLGFDRLFHEEKFVFVIVHAEADYKATLRVGDKLEVHLTVENVGNSSFTIIYKIYKSNNVLAGTAKTVHVTLDSKSRTKIPIPLELKEILKKHLEATA
jgi:1,4-dihydroxy-2-naphthoyl-CoA hydrolase